MSESLNIRVALSTTGYTYMTEEGHAEMEIEMVLTDIPVCAVEIPLPIKPWSVKEKLMVLAETAKSIQVVEITKWNRHVFLGRESGVLDSSLVDYEDRFCNKETDAFFDRYEETGAMMLECTYYQVDEQGNNLGVLLCIRGFRTQDNWKTISAHDSPLITIANKI